MEKVYKTIRNTGASNIAMGIILITVSVNAGVMAIISGAVLLKRKSEIIF